MKDKMPKNGSPKNSKAPAKKMYVAPAKPKTKYDKFVAEKKEIAAFKAKVKMAKKK